MDLAAIPKKTRNLILPKLHRCSLRLSYILLTVHSVSVSSEGQRSMTAAQTLIQQIDSVSRELGACDQQLSTLIHKPLPQNNLGVQDAFRKYRVSAFHCTKHGIGNGTVSLISMYS